MEARQEVATVLRRMVAAGEAEPVIEPAAVRSSGKLRVLPGEAWD